MKIRTKLIATIVSMCAALAVMAVGVWAATTQFTVNVTNTVNFAFETGEYVVEAQATATKKVGEADSDITAAYPNTELFNKKVIAGAYNEATEALGTFNTWTTNAKLVDATAGAATITEDTTEAKIQYIFKLTPSTGNSYANDIVFTLTQNTVPAPKGFTNTVAGDGFAAVYEVSTNGTDYYAITSGTAYTADFAKEDYTAGTQTEVYIRCTLTYKNTNGKAVKVDTDWSFSLVFNNAAGNTPTSNIPNV